MRTRTSGRWRRRLYWIAGILIAMFGLLRFGNSLAILLESDTPSVSHGTPAQGSLEYGKRLPSRGENFRAYSDLGTLLGRNAVHHEVRDTVIGAYSSLATQRPDTVFVYGETGWPSGGSFRPHKTHRNGMAVDFFVPVLDAAGRSRRLPTHVLTRFGYDVEFDQESRWRDFRIDYPAMAAHLRALSVTAADHGLRIEVVIFDNELQTSLLAADGGAGLDGLVRFSRSRPWVRHDEHYHVVFAEAD